MLEAVGVVAQRLVRRPTRLGAAEQPLQALGCLPVQPRTVMAAAMHGQQLAAAQALGHLGVRDLNLPVSSASGGTLRRAAELALGSKPGR